MNRHPDTVATRVPRHQLLACLLLLLTGCQHMPENQADTAERMLDAFYRFDVRHLTTILVPGDDAERLLYYQAWAEAANYVVLKRPPCEGAGDNQYRCAVTVSDDFGQTLGYTATDTFLITVAGEQVTAVSFAGDDPPVFSELFAWISQQQPEVLAGPCKDMFAGGQQPAECATAIVAAAREFVSQRQGDEGN